MLTAVDRIPEVGCAGIVVVTHAVVRPGFVDADLCAAAVLRRALVDIGAIQIIGSEGIAGIAVTGKTTTEVLNERFVLEAKRLLWETDWKIANISWSLGFREANNFSAFFKRHTGVPPTVFMDPQNKAK